MSLKWPVLGAYQIHSAVGDHQATKEHLVLWLHVAFWTVYLRVCLNQGVLLDLSQPPLMPDNFVSVAHKILIALSYVSTSEYATSLGMQPFLASALGDGVLDCSTTADRQQLIIF